MRRILTGMGIRSGEETMAGWVAAVFLMVQTTHGLGANTADALFFRRFGVEFLPYMFMVLGLVTALAMLSYGVALNRILRPRVLRGTLALAAVLYVAEWALVGNDPPGLYPAIWVTVNVVILVTFTLMWNVAGEVTDARQGKRLFPLFASAGILGGIIGNFATGPLAKMLGTEHLLLVAALILLSALAPLGKAAAHFRPGAEPERRPVIDDFRAGWNITRRIPLLGLLAMMAVLFQILFFSVTFPFSEQVAGNFPDEADLAQFLGLFSGAATVVSFLVSLLIANKVMSRFGVVTSVLLLPIAYVAGFALWIPTFTLATAALLRGAQWVMVNAVYGSAFNAYFNVVPPDRRSMAMSFITGVIAQLGIILGGLWLLIAQAALSDTVQFAISLAMAAATAGLVLRSRAAYVSALIDGLRTGLVGSFTPDPLPGFSQVDVISEVRGVVEGALNDEDPGLRRLAVRILGRLGDEDSLDLAATAATDADPAVRLAAVEAAGSRLPAEMVATLLHDSDAAVRAAAIARAYEPASESIARAAADPAPEVRAAAAACLTATDEDSAVGLLTPMLDGDTATQLAALGAVRRVPALHPKVAEILRQSSEPAVRAAAAGALDPRVHEQELLAALEDTNAHVRTLAAEALAEDPAAAAALVDVVHDGSPHAVEAALVALGSIGNYPELEDWACARIDDARRYQDWARRLTGLEGPVMDLLRAALHRAEWRAERNAVRALAAAGKGAGLDLILRGLSQDDMVLRAEALEALEASTHSRSGRMISQLIEDTGKTPEGADPAALVEAIAADHDPWLQALAAGAGLELADRARAAVLARVERDAHPLVVELIEPAARTGGTTMPETLDTLSSLQRMVALRRAHLFKTLEMDDLKTVADLADERLYSAGDVIYADGDEGDEMLVIVEGCAVVSRTTDGERREVRRYDAGEHVGELALLRGRPRSADVHADGDLRGLAITGASLLGLMDERPAIARAMLASLAERLGTTA